VQRTSLRVLALALISVPVAAQRIIRVGQGGQYADIPAAVQAAAAGDVVLVLPGTYSSFALEKGISVVSQGAFIRPPSAFFPTINVWGVPAGQRAAVRGFSGEQGILSLSVSDCAGLVHLEAVDGSRGIGVSRSANVELHRVNAGALSVTDSGLLVEHSVVTGGGLRITRSKVVVAESSISGWPGISLTGGQLTVAGAADTVITTSSPFGPMSAIVITEGQLTLSPQVTLVTTGGAPPVQGGQVTSHTVPSLRADLGGSVLQGRIHAPGAPFALTLVSVAPVAPVPTSVGPFWLDWATAIVVDVGPVSGSFRNLSIPFPPGMSPGLTITVQSLAVSSTSMELSVPALFTLH
jgi:hypothetical protein